jgi:hypothetical protein
VVPAMFLYCGITPLLLVPMGKLFWMMEISHSL